jgi:hypothetical protein
MTQTTTIETTTISELPNATLPLTGAERIIFDQGTQTVDLSALDFVNQLAPVKSVALSLPAGWGTQSLNVVGNVTLSLSLPVGQSLLAAADKTAWDAAAVLAGTAVQPATLATALAGKADLVGGVIPSGQLPALAITDYLGAVASQAALLALTGQRGDWAVRLDRNSVWILSADAPTQLASWVELPIPSGVVLQVNGQTGVVTLGAGDVGADPAGTASSAITAHLLTASHHAPASLAASLQTVFGLSGQELTAQSPGAGLTRLHYWNPATSRIEFLALGTGLSIASGQLNAADLYNLLLPSAAGTYFQYLSSNSVTNGGAGAAASAFTGGMASSSTLPTMGRLDTGTAATGASGLVPTSANAWTGVSGKLSLQAIRSFQTTIWFVSPATLSGGANTYRIFFGWLDSNTYSARNSIGLLINGSALTITSTVAGVESSAALATVTANTNYKVTLIYDDAPTATISANINGGAYTTFAVPSTPTVLGMLGVFIVKETGTTSITFYTSVPQFHTWLSC